MRQSRHTRPCKPGRLHTVSRLLEMAAPFSPPHAIVVRVGPRTMDCILPSSKLSRMVKTGQLQGKVLV
jgi:hypothetical protein